MVFILFRCPSLGKELNYYAAGKKIEIQETYKETKWGGAAPLKAADAVEWIQAVGPKYEPCAYLNGTANPNSVKCLLANKIVFRGETSGYVSPRFMELLQTVTHLLTGT